ncbi:hypothetical protein [Brevundimonas subvibrioides]|uniref:hypothetical protein n=1 Tax=Brevundimonas subvibrioides TaxID=74313 RepID=UPI0022B5B17E|nr:hypothetical protein [Brevundimonas subvibrioides]
MIRLLCVSGLLLTCLSACDRVRDVNPPTEPAKAIPIHEGMPQGTPGTLTLPGRGPVSFVGRWAADVSWCAMPQGERRPIEITPLRFEAQESSCAIASVDEVADGYVATLDCPSRGATRRERVKMAVSADTMTMTWLDRATPPVELHQCTTLADTATAPAGLTIGQGNAGSDFKGSAE